jgi:hypothetical protein
LRATLGLVVSDSVVDDDESLPPQAARASELVNRARRTVRRMSC